MPVLFSSQLLQIKSNHTLPLFWIDRLLDLAWSSLSEHQLINFFSNHKLQFGGCSSGHPCSPLLETLSGLTEATHLPSASLQSVWLQRLLQTALGKMYIPLLFQLTSVSTQLKNSVNLKIADLVISPSMPSGTWKNSRIKLIKLMIWCRTDP